ncbi:porin family protein [Flavobacterium suncheonense]|uniref:Outer membrane protein beta-barrel domain-containing protein n=1 Tax=Flavobacterium suncheonense GH29-5 = DSM 17707 TaxID=1121899 RepID=A0A0A2MN50_9FLAO|nr:porin family protein [Flavobacterium suncheonense]KGO89680.1 hypothetical protein Q764_05655 [Flavobacterium suncheonense GH29-5 = DSM 17707]
MKKVIFSVVLSCIGFIQSNAQVTIKPGVKAGLNISRFTNTDADSNTDFYLGGLVAIKLAKFYTLQPELLYSRQGATVKYATYNPVYFETTFKDHKYNLDYLSVDVINKFTFGKGFQAVVGPALDFKVADNFKETGLKSPEGFDIGIIFGAGYSLPNGLTFEARFKQGFVDIFGNNYNTYYDEEGNGNADDIILNQVFQLGVSYTFDVK